MNNINKEVENTLINNLIDTLELNKEVKEKTDNYLKILPQIQALIEFVIKRYKELKKESEELKKYVKTECVTKTTLKKFIKYHLSDESHKDTKELLERLL